MFEHSIVRVLVDGPPVINEKTQDGRRSGSQRLPESTLRQAQPASAHGKSQRVFPPRYVCVCVCVCVCVYVTKKIISCTHALCLCRVRVSVLVSCAGVCACVVCVCRVSRSVCFHLIIYIHTNTNAHMYKRCVCVCVCVCVHGDSGDGRRSAEEGCDDGNTYPGAHVLKTQKYSQGSGCSEQRVLSGSSPGSAQGSQKGGGVQRKMRGRRCVAVVTFDF
jgi:hypothetical protein